MKREDLEDIVFRAVTSQGGSAAVVDVARFVWNNHETDLRASGDLFFTWQYDIRWAAQRLRDSGKFKDSKVAARGRWEVK
ncbi:hypothetical protein F9K79_17660 [Ochrobactrum sp. Kaboul]|jgi:hypothetical protein|nr:hypothetical protein F9K79_17660 [Ochrobactrum sp. Kaboul]